MTAPLDAAEAAQCPLPSICFLADGCVNYIGINITVTPEIKSSMAARLLRYEAPSQHATNPLPAIPQGRSRYIIPPPSRRRSSRFLLLHNKECSSPSSTATGIAANEPVVWLPAQQIWVKNRQGNVVPPSNKLLNSPQSFVSLLGRDGTYAAVCHVSQVERVIAYIVDVNSAKSERLCIATGGVDFPEDERRWMYVMSCHGVGVAPEEWEGFEGGR
ncbi:hypothetical protein QBC32DRAFT_220914 [Pseudoneurospora amorphoporcata]|uniref:Uncharacterized protein n=1 Tax=Pseudoneurospora amorphoporcata TaxID=241081 RepID=A0AAN6NN22_9PEZI|nr:hypothetical protein QBC32DRAFT_220914 [Pseudoneurospora amorphoporcata]